MPAQAVSITEAARNLSDFVNRVAYRQEHFYLIRGRRPVAELRPVPTGLAAAEWRKRATAWPTLSKEERGLMRSALLRLRKEERG